jgi:opacity protein-like surface antigen
MYKKILTIIFVTALTSTVFTQETYHKIEVSGSYSIMLAKGIVGDGDIFTDDLNDPLPSPNVITAIPNNTTLFPATPLSFSGNRHRAKLHGFNGSITYNFSKYVGAKVEVSGNFRSNDVQTGTVALVVPCLLPLGPCTAVTLQSPQIANTWRALIAYSPRTSETNQKHYNYLGGIQIKNNSTEKKVKPFAHAMAGVSQQTVELKDFTDNGNTFDRANDARKIFGTDKISNTGFALQFGGGLDIRLSKRIDLRVVQVDYNPVKIKEQEILGFQQAITGINILNNPTFLNTASPGFTQYSPYDIRVRSRWQQNLRFGFGIVFH